MFCDFLPRPSLSPRLLPPETVNQKQGDGGGDDDDHEDDLFDAHLPTRELAAMSIDKKKKKPAAGTKKKPAAASKSMSFSERVKSRFGDTSTPASTLPVRGCVLYFSLRTRLPPGVDSCCWLLALLVPRDCWLLLVVVVVVVLWCSLFVCSSTGPRKAESTPPPAQAVDACHVLAL